MASIRIPFPEQSEPGLVVLQGPRVTVGRLPFNTLQIIDRTISGFHAELILENGHYRLHDRGSTNGTFVNGQPATDFHLREACKITFGTVECEFDPAVETSEVGEAVPTREEVNAVRQENTGLRATLAAVREEVKALREAKPTEQTGDAVAREEFMKVVAEREVLTEGRQQLEQEVARLKGEIAVLRRDRENLQKAWDATKAELAQRKNEVPAAEVVEREPAPEATVPEPEPVSAPVPLPLPAPVVPLSRPAVPLARPAVPVSKPVVPMAAPTARSFPPPKPATPPARLVPVSAVPAQTSSGVRPFPRAVPAVPAAAPTPAAPTSGPKPVPSTLHPRASVMAVHPPVAGPKGTQKIE
ncbi:MAG: FHA domain-containing protein [Chthoniobacter sp.]|nr:FHA domain-containing protein [Chthoniobacter sp.]